MHKQSLYTVLMMKKFRKSLFSQVPIDVLKIILEYVKIDRSAYSIALSGNDFYFG